MMMVVMMNEKMAFKKFNYNFLRILFSDVVCPYKGCDSRVTACRFNSVQIATLSCHRVLLLLVVVGT